MHQDIQFKFIKDKNLRNLYQTIWVHLKYIDNISSNSELTAYHSLFKAYKNGYTSNHKLFKLLLKTHKQYPDIFLDWIPVYINAKSSYLGKVHIKRLDDLYKFAEMQSKFGFLCLITDKLAKHHLSFINDISKIDVIGQLLCQENAQLYLPTQLIDDFGIEQSLDGTFMQNEKYIALWEYLHFKVQGFIQSTQSVLIQFNDIEATLIASYIEHIQKALKIKRHNLIAHLKTLP